MARVTSGSVYRPKYTDRNGRKKKSKVWWVKYYVPGEAKPRRESSETDDKDKALEFLKKQMAQPDVVLANNPGEPTVSILLDLLVKDWERKGRRSTADLKSRLEKHLRPFFGLIKCSKLTQAHIDAFIDLKLKEGLARATVNRLLANVRRAINLGRRQKPRVITDVFVFEKLDEGDPRAGVVWHEVYRTVRDLLPSHARLALVIGYHTGARKKELVSILRSDVDRKAARILRPGSATKSKRPRYLPIYGDMDAEIDMAMSGGDPECPFLIQYRKKPVASFYTAWERACKLAGVPATLFHDLRRTALTNMIEAGLSEKEAMEISGHKTRAVFDRYHIVSSKRLKANALKLQEALKAKDAEVEAQQQKMSNLPN